MRVTRGLQKLRKHFAKLGYAGSAVALASRIGEAGAAPLPTGFVGQVKEKRTVKNFKMTVLTLILASLPVAVVRAAEPGTAVTVAPDIAGTRIQAYPRAAWSEKARCWLVAWREGDVTEEKAEIWCARVSADGQSLDPKGICLAPAKNLCDRPSVACDGKDFLVVWEDFRNGKDWDVSGARVSGDGKLLDPGGVVVVGGQHNQCRPVATFCKGQYAVVFQGFVAGKGPAGAPGTGYVTQCMRLSADGKSLDQDAVPVSDPLVKQHVWQPFAAAGGDAPGYRSLFRETSVRRGTRPAAGLADRGRRAEALFVQGRCGGRQRLVRRRGPQRRGRCRGVLEVYRRLDPPGGPGAGGRRRERRGDRSGEDRRKRRGSRRTDGCVPRRREGRLRPRGG
jgi:hypothetical protein